MAGPVQEAIGRVRSAAELALDQFHLPGLSVGLVHAGELVYSEGFGFADIESGRRQHPKLRQRIGSITKTMVGLCAMALVDEGRLSLDDRVVDHLPDVILHGDASSVLVRHLLTHTSGIGEVPMPEDIRQMEPTLWSDEPDVPGVPAAYPSGITLDVSPGTKWAYANHGFVLLGEVIARIEGSPIEEVLRRRIFDPLGMGSTDCRDRPHHDLSTGYHRPPSEDERALMERVGNPVKDESTVDGHNIRGSYQYVRGRAAGAVQSTIPDMARYAAALLSRGSGIVAPETFDAMLAPHWCPDDRLQSWGLAFHRVPRFGCRTFGHGGGVAGGWNTMLTVVPSEDLAVLVHCNLAFDDFQKLDGRILAAALGASPRAVPAAATDPVLLAAAPGVYEATPGQLTNFRIIGQMGRLQIKAIEGDLVLYARRGPWKRGARMRLIDASAPTLFALDDDELEPSLILLEPTSGGAISGLRCDRLVYMVRTEAVPAWV